MTDHGRQIGASLFLGLILGSAAFAQSLSDDAPLPGGSYNGRYIGFQPRYGRVPPPRLQESDSKAACLVELGEVIMENEGDVVYDAPFQGQVLAGGNYQAKIWGRAEAVQWWTKGMGAPVLATTSRNGTTQDEAGVLGLRRTTVLFGGHNDVNEGARGGGRYTFGFWADDCHTRGFEFSYLNLETEGTTFEATGDTRNILARPFFSTVTDAEDSRLIVFPDLVDGSLDIDIRSKFETAEILWRRTTSKCGGCVDYYFGYRHAKLEDQIGILEETVSLDGPTEGTQFSLADRFETENEFSGGQFSARLTSYSSPVWSLEWIGKIALGNTRTRAVNHGSTRVTTPNGTTSTQNAGLLVQGTNSGTFTNDEFSTIAELGVTLRRHFAHDFAITFGYTAFLWTDVIRAGDAIDTTINVSQIPPGTLVGESRPAFFPQTSNFWAQGLRLGLEYAY